MFEMFIAKPNLIIFELIIFDKNKKEREEVRINHATGRRKIFFFKVFFRTNSVKTEWACNSED